MSQQFKQCPVCGGAIHPIAGRCKHCKTDLVKLAEHQSQAQRASRMAAPAAMPAGHVAVPPQPTPGPSRATPQQAASAPLPPTFTAAPQASSTWARRWPYAVGGIALIAIGISVGVLVGQPDDGPSPKTRANPSRSPHMVPDDMPQPAPPMSRDPLGPHSSLPPGLPNSPPSRPPGNPPNAGMFPVALTNAVCAKLTDCGQMDDFSVLLCRELADQLQDPDADAKVQRGECTYDPDAAVTCLDTIGNLDCTGQTADVMTLMTQAGSLFECTSVYVCM